MNTIRFNNVVPQVFSASGQLDSGVWQHDILFEKGKVYLVEADSGKGKSTFCSYIQGYRHDFSGQILFDDTDILRLRSSQWVAIRQRNISLLFQGTDISFRFGVTADNQFYGRLTRRQSSDAGQVISSVLDMLQPFTGPLRSIVYNVSQLSTLQQTK